MSTYSHSSCPHWLQAPIIAVQFLTRIPMPNIGLVDDPVAGRSFLYYPAVGLLLGGLLYLTQFFAALLWPHSVPIQAAIVLLVWCLLTGGLHLDGLADAADAWVGGFGDRQRTLELMKDPTCGPIAVMVLVLLLILKYALLLTLLSGPSWGLLLAPVLARGSLLLLFLTTPYVRAGGLGDVLSRHLPRPQCVVLLLLLALGLLFMGQQGFLILLFVLLAFAALRQLMMKRLAGTTGDTAGALVEVVEVAVLMALTVA